MKVGYSEFVGHLPKAKVHSKYSTDYLKSIQLHVLSPTERDSAILGIISRIFVDPHVRAGQHRKEQWDEGWGENLNLTRESDDLNSIIPKYYGKYPYIRLNGELFKTSSQNDELLTVQYLTHYIFENYLAQNSDIVELGCGTGHHLVQMLQHIDQTKNYYGLDWASSSQEIISLVSSRFPEIYFEGKPLNFYNPPSQTNYIPERSSIFTFAALEQIGENHSKIIDFIINSRPAIVVHLEPISELLDKNSLLQNLSCKYFESRNYLKNFYNTLVEMESSGKINIHHAGRTGIGSYFIEGYSMLVWSPK